MPAQRRSAGGRDQKKESVLVDRRSAEVEVRLSEPQASGAVGGEVLQIPNKLANSRLWHGHSTPKAPAAQTVDALIRDST